MPRLKHVFQHLERTTQHAPGSEQSSSDQRMQAKDKFIVIVWNYESYVIRMMEVLHEWAVDTQVVEDCGSTVNPVVRWVVGGKTNSYTIFKFGDWSSSGVLILIHLGRHTSRAFNHHLSTLYYKSSNLCTSLEW
jgi:hypothetical protein